ncbi:MAG TPA: coproporphyrinogen dehydrogenase HemZ [Clostridia bacterium]|nr:coproporphyrinogen dehydrogenase HemZ [Clostridia bacterium]
MLYVKFDTDMFRYEIEDIIKLFFEEQKIEPVDREPPTLNGGIFLNSSLIEEEKGLFLHVEIKALEGTRHELSYPIVPKVNENVSCQEQKNTKRKIKRNVYCILSFLTGKELPWGILTGIRPAKIVHDMFEEGKKKEEIIKKLSEYYMVSIKKSELLYKTAEAEKKILNNAGKDSVSIYIGIPFCKTRCIYCSFTSYSVDRYSHMLNTYLDSLKKEIRYVSDFIRTKNIKIQSIYIGGGTPTSLELHLLYDLIDCLEKSFNFDKIEEFTLEAGRPDTIDRDKLKLVKESKVDRISINPQTMDDTTLKLIGRDHTSADIINAFNLAREVGIDNINMDVIAGLPGESLSMFKKTMDGISMLCPESLTVHTMAVKRASRLKEEGKSDSLRPEVVEGMIDLAQSCASEMDMHPYYLYRQKNMLGNLENIGYCKPGRESIYNIQIMEERQTIIAMGAGAITKAVFGKENRIERAFNVKSVEDYISRTDEMIDRKRTLLEQLYK